MPNDNPFIKVTWEDVPENFTPEKIKRVKSYFQEKYNSKNMQTFTNKKSKMECITTQPRKTR